MKSSAKAKKPNKIYRAININVGGDNSNLIREFGLWKFIWGTDIFINGLPFMKCLVLANIVVWVIIWAITWMLFK